ncbi:MAG TPA: hypothetical protein VJ761_05355 [Ktedonobacteraceae bacterium]|nr:hypothetical protein [Ktedonobacteraceae bacterium]
MNAALAQVSNLSIEHAVLEQVTFETLKNWLDLLSCTYRIQAEYVLLSKEDHEAISEEVAMTYWEYWRKSDGSSTALPQRSNRPLKKMYGMYIASLPDLPREAEYTRAHLIFARHGYQHLPTLGRGEVLIIFPQTEMWLSAMSE